MTTLALSRGWSRTAASSRVLFAAMLMVRRANRWVRIRTDRRRLQAMPDYLLKDIGLSRTEIEDAVEFGRSRTLPDMTRL